MTASSNAGRPQPFTSGGSVPEQATAQITAYEASVEVLVVVLAVAAGISTLAGGAAVVWWFVKPRVQAWAVTQIVDPVRNVERQVTVNGGRSNPPTLLDKVGTVQAQVADVRDAQTLAAERAAELAAEQAALNAKIDAVDQKVNRVDEKVNGVDYKVNEHIVRKAEQESDILMLLAWVEQGRPIDDLWRIRQSLRPPPDPDAGDE